MLQLFCFYDLSLGFAMFLSRVEDLDLFLLLYYKVSMYERTIKY